ncbi:hypothetical protein VBI23_00270 [Streptococcus uberis]|uniref:hypothetical protein n=1 Tax=Streptococcus uberis TaxID=1349 RepID=UPI0018E1CB84|nr:hypothetical protein [Streptococcus uberis]MBI0907793.1 hypothetical protein [Streptococcus uberis]MCK1202718.1 hypothetical protein [Streptococcus uberis]
MSLRIPVINKQFIKKTLNMVSLITCIITLTTSSDISNFTSTSIMHLSNNLISITDFEFNESGRFSKFLSMFVKSQFILIVFITLLSIYQNDLNKIGIMTYLILVGKFVSIVVGSVGAVVLWLLIGNYDSPEDLNNQNLAKKIIQHSNEELDNDMMKRKLHYKMNRTNFISQQSYRKPRGKK